MGVIVFHAGTPKTGSTTIQDWLAERLAFLQARGIQCVRIAQSSPEAPITLDPADREGVVSKFVLPRHRENWPALTESICAALDAQAGNSDVTVVTSESYEVLFNDHRDILDNTDATDSRATLGPFDELAKSHAVRVAYYVRPQDSWLESAWLQWGFRHFWSPQGWIRTQQRRISYLQTWQRVHEAAPSLSFEIRPFRRDLLAGGHVVADFASTFLGLDVVREPTLQERWANRSLPLEVAILLRQAPAGLFWSSIHDNRRISALKDLILSWDLPRTDLATRSREVLRRYAYTTFESDNRRLIDEFGWHTEHFIEPGDGDTTAAPANLAELDLLWKASASEAERNILFRALRELLEVEGVP